MTNTGRMKKTRMLISLGHCAWTADPDAVLPLTMTTTMTMTTTKRTRTMMKMISMTNS